MRKLHTSAQIYIVLLTLLTSVAVVGSTISIADSPTSWLVIFGIALSIAFLDVFPINFGKESEQVEITISSSIKFAAVLLSPPSTVILAVFLGTVFGEIFISRTSWVKKVFNVSAITVTWVVVCWTYSILNEPQYDYFGSIRNMLALISAGLIDFFVNSALVGLVISLATRKPFDYIWRQNSGKVIWNELSIIPIGTFLAVLWRFNPLSIVLAALPLLVVRNTFKVAHDLQVQTHHALHALVQVVDERDHHTFDHSDLVSNCSRSIAEALGLPPEEIDVIASAALLHDLGKVGMADDILFGPKLLNSEERQSAENHAAVGAYLLSKFPLFEKGAILVRHHHERYDGNGYPDRLLGEAIPIGARIISVADAYQAMTEDRPYRRALSQAEALGRLVEGSGTQFDPQVVDAFLKIMRVTPEKEKEPSPQVTPKLAEA